MNLSLIGKNSRDLFDAHPDKSVSGLYVEKRVLYKDFQCRAR